MAIASPVYWAIALGVLGAIAGSFIATLVIRWPQGRSVMQGRSACDACGHRLRARDLVPLLSLIVLGGRCRDCMTRIIPFHAGIEVAGLFIGATAGWVAGDPRGLAGAFFGWLLLALGALDYREFWLPDRLIELLVLAGLLEASAVQGPALADRLIGGAMGFSSLWLIAFAYRRLRGHAGMGGGDPKLMGAIGLWLGWRMLAPVLLLASLAGMAVVLVAEVIGRPMSRTTALPLGTLLALSAYPAWLATIIWQ